MDELLHITLLTLYILLPIIIVFFIIIHKINKKIPKAPLKVNFTREPQRPIKKKKVTKLKSTFNPLKWGKYTLVINSASQKFTDIYNFDTPQEYKEVVYITLLANTLLLEEARLKKLLPDDFEALLAGLGGQDIFSKLIKPAGNTNFDFNSYRKVYNLVPRDKLPKVRPQGHSKPLCVTLNLQ